MLNSLTFFLMPFIQIGFTYWVSPQTVLAGAVLIGSKRALKRGLQRDVAVKAGVIVLMFLPLLFNLSSASVWDFFRNGREAFFFVLLSSVSMGAKGVCTISHIHKAERAALIMVAGITGLVLVQAAFLARNVYFGIPPSFFIANADTLPVGDMLQFANGAFRPTATFGEPSYCGFILFSTFMMFAKRVSISRNVRIMIAMIFVDAVTLRSMSFLLALLVMSYFLFLRHIRLRRLLPVLYAGLIVLPIVFYFGNVGLLLSRVTSLTSSQDYSALARVGVPMLTIIPYLSAHPFGVPVSTIIEVLNPFTLPFGMAGDEILQNALFNFFFFYGILGAVIVWAIVRTGSDINVKLYMLFCANFNGGLLSVDKFAVMCLAICFYETAKVTLASNRSLRKPLTVPVFARPPGSLQSNS